MKLIPTQPKDRNDPTYKIISEFLNRCDQKIFAVELGVTPEAVNQVVNGRARSQRIWAHVIKVVLNRKEQKDQFLTYMKS